MIALVMCGLDRVVLFVGGRSRVMLLGCAHRIRTLAAEAMLYQYPRVCVGKGVALYSICRRFTSSFSRA